MKAHAIDTEDAGSKGFAFAALMDARMKNLKNINKFTTAQIRKAQSVQAVLMTIYEKGLDEVCINYRPSRSAASQFIAIKVINPVSWDKKSLKLIEDGWEQDKAQYTVTKKVSDQGIIYCFKFV